MRSRRPKLRFLATQGDLSVGEPADLAATRISEKRARQQIDLLLQQSGWIVQDRSQINLAAGSGVAIREALLKTGEADYLLSAEGKGIATVEAKPEGYTLTRF